MVHLVYVYSQDATVLGGSIGEMHAKKIVKSLQPCNEGRCTGNRFGRLCRNET